MTVVHVSTRTPHRTGLKGRPHTPGDSTSHTARHYSGIPHKQISPTKHTPALLGKRWHPAHPRMYRCRPAAAAPLSLPISNPSDAGRPQCTHEAGTHPPRPTVARAPPPTLSSSATQACSARRTHWIQFGRCWTCSLPRLCGTCLRLLPKHRGAGGAGEPRSRPRRQW